MRVRERRDGIGRRCAFALALCLGLLMAVITADRAAAANQAMKLLKAKAWEGAVDIIVRGTSTVRVPGKGPTIEGQSTPSATTHVEFRFDKVVHRERYRATWSGKAEWSVTQRSHSVATAGGQVAATGQTAGGGHFATTGTFSLNFYEERDSSPGCWNLKLDPKAVRIRNHYSGLLGSGTETAPHLVTGSADADDLVGDLPADGNVHGRMQFTQNAPDSCGGPSDENAEEQALVGQLKAAAQQALSGVVLSAAEHTVCWNIHPVFDGQKGRGGGATACATPHLLPPKKSRKVEIVAPSRNDLGKRQFSFDASNPGVLTFHARAVVGDGVDPNTVTWSLQKIGNAKIDIEPAKGTDVDITVTGIPGQNAQFGKKTLTASIPGASDSETIEVFFPPTATNHPGPKQGTNPNWFYYWGQTEAGRGYHPEYHLVSPCHTQGVMGNYFYYRDKIYLYKSTYGSVCMNRPDGSAATGFDCYGETLRHESVHKREMHEWWDHLPDIGNEQIRKYLHAIGPPECAKPPAEVLIQRYYDWTRGVDSDGDLVPDYIEKGLAGCDPHKGISCPTIPPEVKARAMALGIKVLDAEMDAYWIGWKQWPLHHDDKEDWSKCGKQWKDAKKCPNGKTH